jgi:phage shock protein A
VKRKDVQRLAHELVDAITAMRHEMAHQDATIQQQAAEIDELKRRIRATSSPTVLVADGFAVLDAGDEVDG